MDSSEAAMDLEGSGPLVVVSPHLDDAVLSCGDLLARHPGSTVITVFAGQPATYPALTRWDASAGFVEGDDVVALRRREDALALSLLDARPHWLDFVDTQYGASPDLEAVATELRRAIAATGLTAVIAPLGLYHPDHQMTSNAALTVASELPGVALLLYEDAIYRPKPGYVARRLAMLRDAGWLLTGPSSIASTPQKRSAAKAYASQLRALSAPGHPGFDDAFEPERYWRIEAPI